MKPTPITTIPEDYAPSVRDRIRARVVESESGCWIWTGQMNYDGYGKLKLCFGGRRATTGTHRAAWLAFMGDIPEGFQVDHLCRVRACCNPAHLEAVTPSVNTLRSDHSGKVGRSGRLLAGGLLHSCGKHGREEGILRTRPDGYNYWYCRICTRRRVNEFNARKRAALAA